MSNAAKIETLTAAVNAAAECLKAGHVTIEAVAPIRAAIGLGIAPPFVRPGQKPFVMPEIKEAPGAWGHYTRAIRNIVNQQMDLGVLREKAKAGDVAAERAGNFMNMVLTSVHGALVSALRRLEEVEQSEARKAREAKERQETEQKRLERAARKAALDALEAAAAGNSQAPEQAKPQSRRRTPEGVTRLIASLTARDTSASVPKAAARLGACCQVFSFIHEDSKSGLYTESEITSLKDAVKAEVTSTYFSASGKLTEAEREAKAWMKRGEEAMAEKDRKAAAARKTASAPPAAKTPAAEAPKPAAKPAPKKAEKPAEAPAKPPTLSVDTTTQPETAIGLALQRALGGKAANG